MSNSLTRIVLLSDTHGYLDDALLEKMNWADEVWHAGDIGDLSLIDRIEKIKPVRAVYGNIDNAELRLHHPLNQVFNCQKIKVVMTHIAGYPGRYSARVKELLDEHRPQLFICGHSHILKVMKDPKRGHIHMNPGAAGKHGFHQMRTLLRFEINGDTLQNLAVIELGKRGALS
ncbi:MAG: metallophosphoesterase family protein [Flavobacteriaceae bacterium]